MEANTVTFSVYDPNGIRVTFALPLNEIAAVNGVIADVLANGFTATVAGAAPGENVEEVGYVSRREKSDGTPVIDLFSPNEMLAHRVFAHYLDTPEQIADFETATGLKLSEIPVWIAEQPIKKTSPTWKQYGVQTRKVARIALKDNPRHDPNETDVAKKKPKHLFSQWLPSTTPPTETRYPAILNRDGKPTGAQPQPSANPTPPQPSPTEPTEQASGASANGVKVIDGGNPASFDEVFGKRLERVTPDALFATSANLFNARPHFENWWDKHISELDTMTLTDAVTFVGNERWSRDKERVKLLVQFGERVGLQHTEVLDALSTAAGKKLDAFSKWDHGNFAYAHAAVMAYHAGFNRAHADQLLNDGVLPQEMYQQVVDMCIQFGKASA